MSRRPIDRDTVRPWRLWDELEQRKVPYRHYLHLDHAHDGAVLDLRRLATRHRPQRRAKVVAVVTVWNITNGNTRGQYTATVNGGRLELAYEPHGG